jgi:uncharacterized protein YecT (DUF1311 family)
LDRLLWDAERQRATGLAADGDDMLISVMLALQVAVSGVSDETEGCTDKEGPRILSACYSDHAAQWEQRMAAAYPSAMKAQDKKQRTALATSQARWLAYRRAECGFYANPEGSLAYIQSAYCMLDLTRRRALELEELPLP